MLESAAAVTVRTPSQSSAARGFVLKTLAMACCLFFSVRAFTQSPAPAGMAQTPGSAQSSGASNTSEPAQQTPRVTTTVVVHGDVKDNYLPDALIVGTLDGATLQETPLSVTVMTRDLLSDQVSRLISDVVKNDASVGDDYVPVGYYGTYMIRGFPLDLATGFEVNGMTIAGEQDVPLENKQSVEILKGIAGVESGVASAGGLIDYVTKRPAIVKTADLSTDQRGTAYGAVDLGRFFGSQKQVGARVNLASERIVTYMNDTNGWRAMGAGEADWKISSQATLKGDFEYQHKTERDGSGYQLLGGTTVPDINKIYRSTMLGDQPWGPPDTYDTFNTGARLDYRLPRSWAAYVAASYSHSLIQDNVIYAYGSSLVFDPTTQSYISNCPGVPGAPVYFFCPAVSGVTDGGDYGVYDYRDPGELRIDAESEGMLIGHLKNGAIKQDLAVGGELFLRSVQQPGFFTAANPYSPDGIVQDGAVYTYLGSENIYQPIAPIPIESPLEAAGPRRLWEDSHQAAAIMQDRIHLPGHIQLIAGGRIDSLRDHNYSAYASCSDFSVPGACTPQLTNKSVWLPQYAVTFNPVEDLTLYGNYGVLLSLGPQGPFWTDNGSQFLAPFFTRQAEVGAKYQPGQRILLTAAFYHMRAPFFYPKTIAGPDSFCSGGNTGDQCFESEGRETHDGVELNAEGKATNWIRLTASAAAINAISDETGTPSFDNKQVINVPHLHATMYADLTVPRMSGLHIMPGWSYTGSKEATRDDQVSVPSYNLFNLGARYTPGGEQGRVTFRIYANNITDKRYWSDTGASYGDTFIWLGAPTTVRLSAHYTF
jgi:iron complex outermembrane recepter protein